ncbi:hypothetical protein LL270_09195 [Pseudomonas aestusnigri]|uniref:hypothetical protein n=1 Tax=Halopseudomonas aestusnigri TaxID=857252 RepID=UPI001D187545|nr:hypothetical protein [Halopseudomonas aestusnigri]MCC4260830.1 hypothetical protein [Halopseudomonas aestusnigri]
MKTDRELLELAAKAAGKNLLDWRWIGSPIPGFWWCPHGEPTARTWNPLIDDGDALRLAEFLGLTVCMDGIGTVSACDQVRTGVFFTQGIRECGSRIEAARRAITRAAAEIGEKMAQAELSREA